MQPFEVELCPQRDIKSQIHDHNQYNQKINS